MVAATDALGHIVYVTYINDCESNTGGLWCQVYADENCDRELDDFCIHPDDCDCSDEEVVEAYILGFVSVQEY